jgi:hypothetical protein
MQPRERLGRALKQYDSLRITKIAVVVNDRVVAV